MNPTDGEAPDSGPQKTNDPEPLTARRHRWVRFVVFTTILIDFAGFSLLMPILPLYADRLGASALEVALILSLYALSQLLFLPAWGWFSDRYGRRPVILLSLAGTIGAYVLLVFADTLSMVYVSRVLAGFFAASIGTAQAVVTDITSHEDRARGMGQVGAAVGVGLVIGPAMGGPLASIHESLPFYTVAAIAAVNFGLAWVLLPETRPPQLERPKWSDLLSSLVPTPLRLIATNHDRRIGLYLYLFFHIFTSIAALEGVFPLFLGREFEATEWEIGLIFAWLGVFIVLSQGFLVGLLADRFSEATLVMIGLFLCGVGLLGIPWVPSFGWFYLLAPVVAIGNGIAIPTFTSLFSKACEQRGTGELLGQSQAMATTGRVLGPLWAGYAMDRLLPGSAFVIAGLLLIAAMGIVAVALPTLLGRRENPA